MIAGQSPREGLRILQEAREPPTIDPIYREYRRIFPAFDTLSAILILKTSLDCVAATGSQRWLPGAIHEIERDMPQAGAEQELKIPRPAGQAAAILGQDGSGRILGTAETKG